MGIVDLVCPVCRVNFHIKGKDTTYKDIEGTTCNCPVCKALLILTSEGVANFHEYMNKEDKRWPKDGKGTKSIDV